MSAEKPLYVLVAEALGWTDCSISGWTRFRGERIVEDNRFWSGVSPYRAELRTIQDKLPRYDTDWSATGPLIEKYRIEIEPFMDSWRVRSVGDPTGTREQQKSLLIAICNLILALAEAGAGSSLDRG